MNRARKRYIDNLFGKMTVYECIRLLKDDKADEIPKIWQKVANEYDGDTFFHEMPYEAFVHRCKEEIQELAEAFESEMEFEEYMKTLDEKTLDAMYKYDLDSDILNAINKIA